MTAPTSAWRIGEALSHRAADRVPFFLPVTILGARLLGTSIREYLSSPSLVARGQLAWREKLGHDAVTAFHSAAAEVVAFGGEVLYYDDGPPNAGEPPLRPDPEALLRLEPPRPQDVPVLRLALEATRALAQAVGGEAPVVGAAIGPFSLPAMQLGLPAWLSLLHEHPAAAAHLARVNAAFCAAWANSQIEAGAGVIAMFEPLASPHLVEPARWRALGAPATRAAVAGIRGGVALASGAAPYQALAPEALDLGVVGLVGGAGDDLAALKATCRGRAVLLGGLDSVPLSTMRPAEVEPVVRRALRAAGEGGGFVLFEHHGEIPWSTPDDTLLAVAEAVRAWGRYQPDGRLVA